MQQQAAEQGTYARMAPTLMTVAAGLVFDPMLPTMETGQRDSDPMATVMTWIDELNIAAHRRGTRRLSHRRAQ